MKITGFQIILNLVVNGIQLVVIFDPENIEVGTDSWTNWHVARHFFDVENSLFELKCDYFFG